MLADDIKCVDSWAIGPGNLIADALPWQRIKKFCEEALTKAPNTQSTPCPACGRPWDMNKYSACECGMVLVHMLARRTFVNR